MKKLHMLASALITLSPLLAVGNPTDSLEPPELGNRMMVGRVMAFPTFKQNIWFSPTAFSVDFSCTPGSGESACSVKIFNRLSTDESAELQKMTGPKQQLLFFSDVDSSIVSGIKDEFKVNSPSFQNAKSMLLNSLGLTDRFPYSQIQTRVQRQDAVSLQRQYEGEGLGTFESHFEVSGSFTEEYLAVDDSTNIKAALQSLVGKTVKMSQIKETLIAAIESSSVVSNNFTREEVQDNLYLYLVQNYVVASGRGRYSVSEGRLAKMGLGFNVVNFVQSGKLACTALIEIKKDATPKLDCELE